MKFPLSMIALVALATPCDAPKAARLALPTVEAVTTPEPVLPPKPAAYAAPPVAMTEPSRRWILADETWKRINDSRLGVEVNVLPGQEYLGVRVTIPFGS